MSAPDTRPAVSLVIGSGSVKCAAALGVAKVLAADGIRIDRVVGCSAGAMFAAVTAFGYDMAAATDIAVRTWTREATASPDRLGYLRVLAPKLFGFKVDNFGLRQDALLMQRLRSVFGDKRIEDAPIPLHITATAEQSCEKPLHAAAFNEF